MNLPYSEDEIEKNTKNDLKNELQLFKQRELPESAFALIIDGYHCEIKDNSKVKQATCYVVLGIDLEGKKRYLRYLHFLRQRKQSRLDESL